MNNNENPWFRLAAAARKAQDPRDLSAPPGFATRLAALGLAKPPSALSLVFDRFSWRALGLATLLMAVTVISCYRYAATPSIAEDDSDYQDTVSEILELTS